jgi:hypothetical protein
VFVYMPQIYDMGPPKEGVLRIFFALKNPTASAGFEPANLGTKGQRTTPRPPKPLTGVLQCTQFFSLPRCFQLTTVLLLPKFLLSRSYITFLLQHKPRLGKIRQFNQFSLQKHVMFAIYTLIRDIRLHAAEVTLLFSVKN